MTTNQQPVMDLLGPDVDLARYERGAAALNTVDGAGGQRVVESLTDIAPALAEHMPWPRERAGVGSATDAAAPQETPQRTAGVRSQRPGASMASWRS